MAKKIRLDFSKVEERSGWNTRAVPEGLHKMKIEAVQITEANDSTPMWVYALVPADSRYKTRRFPFYCKLQPNQLWKLRDLFVAAGLSVPKKAVSLDPEAPVGKFIAAEVEDETGQYAGRSSVNAVYGLDILDEEAGDEPEDDEEDEEEEYDDEAEEAEEEDDEEEEDEEEDELLTLTLPELRKLAKSLGIDTNGVKKDDLIELIREEQEDEEADEDDEDDLDDEDLEDEDLDEEEFEDDEEEEEEAPAPRRKAPVRKPAAKAAPKRTVKRR